MKRVNLVFAVLSLLLLLPAATRAQFMRGPQIHGVWNPVVGQGAVYESTDQDGAKHQIQFAVVGKESVDGKDAFWLETVVASPQGDGDMIFKTLMASDGTSLHRVKTIIQRPGSDPMEMPAGGFGGRRRGGENGDQSSDYRKGSELVGTESITTPAGTFSCQHYRAKDGSGDAWISDKVPPYGLVKGTGTDSNMVLIKVITDAKDQITGTPKPFDPTQMRRRPN